MFEEHVSRLLRTDWSKMTPNMLAEELALLLSTLAELVTSGRIVVNYVPQTDDDSSVEFSACGEKGVALRLAWSNAVAKTFYDAARIVDCTDGQPGPPRGALTGQLLGKTAVAVNKGQSGTVNVYEGTPGSEQDSGRTITAWSPFGDVSAGKWVKCTHNGYGWYITAAEC